MHSIKAVEDLMVPESLHVHFGWRAVLALINCFQTCLSCLTEGRKVKARKTAAGLSGWPGRKTMGLLTASVFIFLGLVQGFALEGEAAQGGPASVAFPGVLLAKHVGYAKELFPGCFPHNPFQPGILIF